MIATFVLVSSLVLNWNTSREGHHDWEEVSYKGHTRYSVQGDSTGTWLHAEADGAELGSDSPIAHDCARRDVAMALACPPAPCRRGSKGAVNG